MIQGFIIICLLLYTPHRPPPMVPESTLHDESAARLAVLSNDSDMLAAEVSKLSARLAALKRTLHTGMVDTQALSSSLSLSRSLAS